MQVARRRHPEAALELRAEVGDDVAEHVVRDDDLELAGVLHELHRQRVDVEVRGLDVGMVARDLLEHALPEGMAERERVALVRHAHLRPAVRLRVLERVLDDPVHALEGVDLFLHRDLVLGSRLEAAADVDVQPLGVLAEHHEVDILRAAPLQRTQPLVEQPHRTVVDVEIQLEARAEQDFARMAHVGNARIAEGAHEDRLELVAQHRVAVWRQADAGLEVVIRAVGQHLEVELPAEHARRRFHDLDGFRRDVFPDSVARNHRDAHVPMSRPRVRA